MVERVEGIDRMQSVNNIKSADNRKDINKNDENKSNKAESRNSVDENELSSDKLKKELKETIEDMNKIVETVEENLSFKLHEKTDRLMTQVINIETREVIKEMPPEEMLDLAARIHRMVGIIIDEEV